jgi:hypothetical protein
MSFMKAIILYISLLFFIGSQSLFAQITPYADLPLTCLPNGDFAGACVSGDACDAWTSNCSAGWFRSHGTPTMATYTENGQPKYYIYVWAQGTNNGEGVFTNYYFRNNYTYTVRIRTSANQVGGKARIFAANGLAEQNITSCGSGLPNIQEKEEIGFILNDAGGNYQEFTYTNTSGTLFTQLWIYPERTGSGQYDLNILSVEVCPVCYSSITFNSGVVPSNTTTRGYIYAGSSAATGGAGTVTVNGTATTQLIAANEVNLLPEFEASVTSGTFSAELYTCYSSEGTTRRVTGRVNLPTTPPAKDLEIMKAAIMNAEMDGKLNVYPTISTGLINITGDQSSLENIELAVFDLTGRMVVQLPKKSYAGNANINLGNLNNGTYLLQIKQKDKTITKKIIIRK